MRASTHVGHNGEHVHAPTCVVFSRRSLRTTRRLVEAKLRGTPVIPRAEMLGALMRLQDGIAIAGTHGKTTTTSLLATVLRAAQLDPTVVIGGKLNVLGSGAALGTGRLLVAEADESDGSFLHLSPVISVITNVDREHLDHYGTFEAVKKRSGRSVPVLLRPGVRLLDHRIPDILPRIETRSDLRSLQHAYYGAQLAARGLLTLRSGSPRRAVGRFQVHMPAPNVLNALATSSWPTSGHLTTWRGALATFAGVQRRFTCSARPGASPWSTTTATTPAEIEAPLGRAGLYGAGRVAFNRIATRALITCSTS